jgi:hypothetical protein
MRIVFIQLQTNMPVLVNLSRPKRPLCFKGYTLTIPLSRDHSSSKSAPRGQSQTTLRILDKHYRMFDIRCAFVAATQTKILSIADI